MATAQPPNAYQSAAQALNSSANRSLHERIFDDALKDARRQAGSRKDQILLSKLSRIHDEASMKATIEQELKNGAIGPNAEKKASRRIAHFCAKVDKSLDLLWRISEANQLIAKPLVGVIYFFATVSKELGDVDGLVGDFEEQTKDCLSTFQPYYNGGDELSEPLRRSLRKFYGVTISFSSTVMPWFRHSTPKMYRKILLDNPKGRLEKVLGELIRTANDVHKAANAETWLNVKGIGHALAGPPIAAAPPGSSSQSRPRMVGFPMMLSRHFTGRQVDLGHISQSLASIPVDRSADVGIFGMPGIGKTQLALCYAHRHIGDQAAGFKYSQGIFLRAKDKAQIQSELRKILVALGLCKDALLNTMEYSWMVEKLKTYLRSTDGWILIFDNVSSNNDLLELRPQEGSGHVIYTTRNKNTAELICGTNINEVLPMEENDGATLVRSWMGSSLAQTAEAQTQARQVTNFAHGLPLAIEQIVQYSKSEKITLAQTLDIVRRKEELLRQRNIDSFQDDNFTVGAILVATFEALTRRMAMAGALFRVLSYLEPSAIYISMLQEGAREMETHLARNETFDRGTIRTRQGQADYQQSVQGQTNDRWFYQRMLKKQSVRKLRRPYLPRVDSQNDIEMQMLWQSDAKLQKVFDNQNQLAITITEIQSSGLLRKVDNDTLWIHDLFAELMTAHTADEESKARNAAYTQTAATLVWLAFPITQKRLMARKKSFKYLPHAQSCLRHLKEHEDLLIEANVGAELSHVVATTFCWRMGIDGPIDSRDELRTADWEMGVDYYKDALRCYIAAQKRLTSRPDMSGWKGMERVADAIKLELEEEITFQGVGKGPMPYSPSRWVDEGELFGSNAVWRCLQTLGRIGQVLYDLERYGDAVWYLKQAKTGMKALWRHADIGRREVEVVTGFLLTALEMKEDWEGALVVAEEKYSRIPVGWSLDEAGQGWRIGELLIKLGRGGEGMQWLEAALGKAREIYGRHGYDTFGYHMALIRGYEEMGDWKVVLTSWVDALGVLLVNDEKEGFFRMDQFVNGFAKARAKCEESNVQIDDALKEKIEIAGKALAFYRGSLEVGREYEELERKMITWEETDEMKYWYKVGKEREWI